MGYRIIYGRQKRRFPLWVLLIPAALAMLFPENWYEDLARYVGEAIRGH